MVSGMFCASVNYAVDTLFIICMNDLCARICILQQELMNIGTKIDVPNLQITHLINCHQREIK